MTYSNPLRRRLRAVATPGRRRAALGHVALGRGRPDVLVGRTSELRRRDDVVASAGLRHPPGPPRRLPRATGRRREHHRVPAARLRRRDLGQRADPRQRASPAPRASSRCPGSAHPRADRRIAAASRSAIRASSRRVICAAPRCSGTSVSCRTATIVLTTAFCVSPRRAELRVRVIDVAPGGGGGGARDRGAAARSSRRRCMGWSPPTRTVSLRCGRRSILRSRAATSSSVTTKPPWVIADPLPRVRRRLDMDVVVGIARRADAEEVARMGDGLVRSLAGLGEALGRLPRFPCGAVAALPLTQSRGGGPFSPHATERHTRACSTRRPLPRELLGTRATAADQGGQRRVGGRDRDEAVGDPRAPSDRRGSPLLRRPRGGCSCSLRRRARPRPWLRGQGDRNPRTARARRRRSRRPPARARPHRRPDRRAACRASPRRAECAVGVADRRGRVGARAARGARSATLRRAPRGSCARKRRRHAGCTDHRFPALDVRPWRARPHRRTARRRHCGSRGGCGRRGTRWPRTR